MPKIPRTPQGASAEQPAATCQDKTDKQTGNQDPSLASLFLAMEESLGIKMDATNTKVDKALELVADTNTALEGLEQKVAASEENFKIQLDEAEDQIRTHVE